MEFSPLDHIDAATAPQSAGSSGPDVVPGEAPVSVKDPQLTEALRLLARWAVKAYMTGPGNDGRSANSADVKELRGQKDTE